MTHVSAPTPESSVDVSIVCPVSAYAGDLAAVHREFRDALEATGRTMEFLYVVHASGEEVEKAVEAIREDVHSIRVLRTARGFGEAAALWLAFQKARGRQVLTIPDHFQIDPAVAVQVLDQLDSGAEMVVTRREPRRDGRLNRLQSRVFHTLVRWMSGRDFRDTTCGVRGMTISLARQLDLYGDMHRFIPILADRAGAQVIEIPAPQRLEDTGTRLFAPGVYARRLLDVLNVFFLTRFVRKPLRFFGLLGSALGFVGFLICAGLAVAKIFFGAALADRPLLLLGVLLLVLGVQLASIGLIGEIITFLASRRENPEVVEMEVEEP